MRLISDAVFGLSAEIIIFLHVNVQLLFQRFDFMNIRPTEEHREFMIFQNSFFENHRDEFSVLLNFLCAPLCGTKAPRTLSCNYKRP